MPGIARTVQPGCHPPVNRLPQVAGLSLVLSICGCKGDRASAGDGQEGADAAGGAEASSAESTDAHDAKLPIIARLDVRDRTPRARHPAPGVTPERLRAAVRATLQGVPGFEVPAEDAAPDRAAKRATYRATVELTLSRQAAPAAVAQQGVGTAHVYIQMDRVSGGAGIESHGAEATADEPVPGGGAIAAGSPPTDAGSEAPGAEGAAGAASEGDRFWLGLLKQATSRAFHVVVVQVDARKRDATALQDDLASKDVAVRQEAVRELGRRGEVQALDAIAGLLDDPHQDVVLASVGALTNLRDQKAATPLIASTRGRSNEYLAAVIGALRTIGGVESEAYLDALATGHPSDDIKARATQALLDVRARRYAPRKRSATTGQAGGAGGAVPARGTRQRP